MSTKPIQVLLIDDDEDDYIITSEMLEDSQHTTFALQWVNNYQDAWSTIQQDQHDVYLIDYRLGHQSGLDIVQQALAHRCKKPLILLTGQGDHEIEIQAMNLGASDYLVKGEFTAELLERAINYAIRHKNTLNSLEQSESRYRAVIESQSELICRFKPDTTLTFVNGAYCRYFQKTAEELVGQSWLTLIPENQHPMIKSKIVRMLENRQPLTYEHKVLTPAGLERWQQWTDQVVSAANGSFELQSIGVDVTERKEAELALKEALEKERELNELKSRFVAMASHEFRTPLAKIMGMASFLEMAEYKIDTEKRIARLKKIQRACREMTVLMDDVLIYGKAEADRLEFVSESVDIIAFTKALIEDNKVSGGEQHYFIFNHHEASLFIDADEKLLRQIVNNLITNAIKYSPKGSTVTIDIIQDGHSIDVRVQDEGIGIPQADQQRLFEPFHRATNVRNTSGTGLGLAITVKAIEMHNGSITFHSEEGVGTCFIVTLPMQSKEVTTIS